MRESETREVLLDKLIGIQDLEAIKPIHDMDTDLITECTECIIELTGDELPSESALEQMKQRLLHRLFSRNTRRKGLARKLLIAAIIVILIVAVSVSMMPLGTNDESLFHRWGFFFLQKDSGYRIDYDDYLTLIGGGEIKEFNTIRQFIRKTRIDILVPTELPRDYSIQSVQLYFDYTFDSLTVNFCTNDPSACSVIVYLGKEISMSDTVEKAEHIGQYDCWFSISPEWCQCDFNYNGNGYSLMAKTQKDLLFILNHMKGSLKK